MGFAFCYVAKYIAQAVKETFAPRQSRAIIGLWSILNSLTLKKSNFFNVLCLTINSELSFASRNIFQCLFCVCF